MDDIEVQQQLEELRSDQHQAKDLTRRIELSKEFGDLERRVRAFFKSNPLIADLEPSVWRWTNQGKVAKAFQVALERAKDRFEAIHRDSHDIVQTADTLLTDATHIADNQTAKRTHKTRAVELIKRDRTAKKNLRFAFTSHMPSAALIEALKEIRPQTQEVKRTIGALEPWAARRDLKRRINAFLESRPASLPDMRPRTRGRIDHAPMGDLIEMLEELRDAVNQVNAPEKLRLQTDNADHFIQQLDTRVRLSEERESVIKHAKLVERSLGAERKESKALLKKLNVQIKREQQERLTLTEQIERRNEERLAAVRALEPHEISALELSDQYDRLLAIDCEMGCAALRADKARIDALPPVDQAEISRLRTATADARTLRSERQADLDVLNTERNELQHALDRDTDEDQGALRAALNAKQEACEQAEAQWIEASRRFDDADEAYSLAFDTAMEQTILSRVYTSLPADALSSDSKCEDDLQGTVDIIRVDVLRSKQMALEHCTIYRERLRGAEDAHSSAITALVALETRLFEDVSRQAYLISNVARIGDALKEAKVQWKFLADTETLVVYVRMSENLYEKCLNIAKVVKGGYTGADAMGRLKLVILVEAGVKAGYDFGLKLSAKVSATLQLSGELCILDSREMAFSHHVTLFLSAGANAGVSITTPEIVPNVLPPSELLMEASVRCSATLYDKTGYKVYEGEEHWATYWADAIARRVALIRSVRLTKNGLEHMSEEWLSAQLAELSSSDDSLAWIATLNRHRRKKPRKLAFKRQGFGVEGTVTATVNAGQPRPRNVGTKAGQATFILFDGETNIGELVEDSCEFIPAPPAAAAGADAEAEPATHPPEKNFKGHAVYHKFTSGNRVQEFLEVRKATEHNITCGDFNFSSATTRNRLMATETQAAVRGRRALANALDVNPGGNYIGKVALPKLMSKSGGTSSPRFPTPAQQTSTKELDALRKTIRMRIDIVETRGARTQLEQIFERAAETRDALERQMRTLETRLNRMRSGIGRVNQAADQAEQVASSATAQLPGMDAQNPSAAIADAVRSATTGGSAIADAGDQIVENYERSKAAITAKLEELELNAEMLKKSHNTYTRWYRTRVVSLSADESTLEWTLRWTPQVYRGMTVSKYSFSMTQNMPLLPAITAYTHEKISVEAESVRFEALGMGTFSYLKTLFNAFRHSEERWIQYRDMHAGELFDLQKQVARAGSVAFSEVVHDALYGEESTQRAAASAFGAACWRFFNTRENPFVQITEAKVIAALKKPGASRPAQPRPDIPVPAVPVARKALDTVGLTEDYLAYVIELLSLTWREEEVRAIVGRERAHTRPYRLLEPTVAYLEQMIHIRTTYASQLSAHDVNVDARDEKLVLKSLQDVLKDRRTYERELARAIDQRKQEFLAAADVSARAAVAEKLMATALDEIQSLSIIDRYIVVSLKEAPASEAIRAATLGQASPEHVEDMGREAVDMVYQFIRSKPAVPTFDKWHADSKRGLSRLTRRTGRTIELDNAVRFYEGHTTLNRGPSGERPTERDVEIDVALVAAVQRLLMRRTTTHYLFDAINEWHGKRAEASSSRTPNTRCYLELPCLTEMNRCQLAMTSLVVRQRIMALSQAINLMAEGVLEYRKSVFASAAEMANYEREMAAYRQRVRERHAADVITNSANWVSIRAKRMKARLDEMPERMKAYLSAFALIHQYDALTFGQKKVLAPGAELEQTAVPLKTKKPKKKQRQQTPSAP